MEVKSQIPNQTRGQNENLTKGSDPSTRKVIPRRWNQKIHQRLGFFRVALQNRFSTSKTEFCFALDRKVR